MLSSDLPHVSAHHEGTPHREWNCSFFENNNGTVVLAVNTEGY